MVILNFVLDEEGIIAATDSRRAYDRIAKKLHEILGSYWHEHILPRHWEGGAWAVYGYQRRQPSYVRRKRAAAARGQVTMPVVDLRYTGRMQQALQARAEVRAYPSRFSVVMTAPPDDKGERYAMMKPKRADRPNLGAESVAVSQRDMEDLRQVALQELPALIAAERSRRRTRIWAGTTAGLRL